MGAAQTKNTTNLVTDVTSEIMQDTQNTYNSNMVSGNTIHFGKCNIKVDGNFDIKQSADTLQKAVQLNKSMQNAAVSNNIAQKIAQDAASKVGSLGIGYADAENSVNAAINASSEIQQALNNTLNQFSETQNSVTCDDSTIDVLGNFNISQGLSSENIGSQVLQGDQLAKINNDISQSVTQKASATVEGLAGFLLGIALIIAALGYSIAKPLSSGSFKIIIIVVLLVVLVVIVLLLYLKKAPPFFSDLPLCANNDGSNIKTCDSDCIDPKMQTVYIKSPPLKYTFQVVGAKNNVDLARQVIEVFNNHQNNQGYNMANLNTIDDQIKKSVESIQSVNLGFTPPTVPNPLVATATPYEIPDVYRTDIKGSCTPGAIDSISDDPNCKDDDSNKCSSTYCQNSLNNGADQKPDLVLATYNDFSSSNFSTDQWDYIRFVYIDILNRNGAKYVSNNYAISPNDLVQDNHGNVQILKDALKANSPGVFQFTPDNNYTSSNMPVTGGGNVTGMFGYCNSRQYKLDKFMQNIGKWILLVIAILIFAYLGYSAYKSKKAESGGKKAAFM